MPEVRMSSLVALALSLGVHTSLLALWAVKAQLPDPGSPLDTDTPESSRKALIDALLLKLPGVSARKISGLDAYFVSDRMFACISGRGVGLRLPAPP